MPLNNNMNRKTRQPRRNAANHFDNLPDVALAALSRCVVNHPILWLLLAVTVCGLSMTYTRTHLGINTDTTKILSDELPFQKERQRLERTFPQDISAILLVVEARTPEQASAAVQQLGKRLRAEKNSIQSVYIPGEGDFFEREALLFLEPDALRELTVKMAEAQPFIGRLSANNSLPELLAILGQAIEQGAGTLPVDLDPLLNRIEAAVQAVLNGETYQLSWQQLMLGDDAMLSPTERFVLIKPVFDFSLIVPAEEALTTVRKAADHLEALVPGLRIRMTGEVAMEYDELNTVRHDMTIAGIVSLTLVCLCLGIAFRSLRLVVSTLAVLIAGLILSAGFAALAIGYLNLISVGFAVLYIGLGVDYAIHLCLGYRERIQQSQPNKEALIGATRAVGPSLLLCAITTSIGFFAFIPTAYSGVSQLGLISGVGMFIGFFLTLTMLPALLALFPLRPGRSITPLIRLPEWAYHFPLRHRRSIRWGALILALIAPTLLTQIHFDFNPMNLRDPYSESVVTFKKLLTRRETSPLTLAVLTDGADDAVATAARVETLETVDKAVSILDFIPDQQYEKLAMIEDLALLLGPQQKPFPKPKIESVGDQIRALKRFMLILNRAIENRQKAASAPLIRLSDRLRDLLETVAMSPPDIQQRLLNRLQSSILGTLPATMNRLYAALDAAPIDGIDNLPKPLVERWVSEEGVYRVQIFPKKNLNKIENFREFVNDVQAIEPTVTDLPVIYLESAKAVLTAFQQALISAVIAILVILLIVLRNLKETFTVLVPLLLASLLTGAATVLMKSPFNFANVIALPLLLGLGVDSGIHMIQRLRQIPEKAEELLHTSTARGVFFSSLTTFCSFGTLAFMAHLGTASMGSLLAVGVVFTLVCTLIVLPALAVTETN
jgi:uncharacterized protein